MVASMRRAGASARNEGAVMDATTQDPIDAAATWHARIDAPDMDWAGFGDWLDADPSHRAAYDLDRAARCRDRRRGPRDRRVAARERRRRFRSCPASALDPLAVDGDRYRRRARRRSGVAARRANVNRPR
ncbi:FecR/PupR family sigma factor regulator [Sphingomonas sp. LR59]|uniref:FecR/PupR family sigma factor regulator n=1 Tax=Sphingomonas sp. LR59 TaxID=3050232 RepID=UPI003FA6A037